MNKDGTYTLPEAGQMVAKLKTLIGSPYKLAACASEDNLEGAVSDPETIMQRLSTPPIEIVNQEFLTLSELLTAFRVLQPSGAWLLVIKGQSLTNYKNPAGFIDTPIIEKAIEWHTSQGHEGEI